MLLCMCTWECFWIILVDQSESRTPLLLKNTGKIAAWRKAADENSSVGNR